MDNDFNINTFIDSFLSFHHERNNLLCENINVLYDLSIFVNRLAYFKEQVEQIDWHKVKKSFFLQNLELIDNFYQSIGISFKTNDIIKDGTINIITNDFEETLKNESSKLLEGHNNYRGKHKSIDIYNNGLITDSIVWIHEISHYRNQTENERSQVNHLLTESLAHTTELIYLDYLEKLGYTYESYHIRNILLNTFNFISYRTYTLTKMYLLYQELGDTSKESYKYYYKDDKDYEKIRNRFINTIEEDQDAIFKSSWYTLSGTLSIYMYERYKIDNNFLMSIEKLNNALLTDRSMHECLNIIGITGYNEESLNKIEETYNTFKKSLQDSPHRVLKK